MGIDYTKIFKTPEELVDFLLLDADEQGKIILRLSGSTGIEENLSCAIKNRKWIQDHVPEKKGAELGCRVLMDYQSLLSAKVGTH